MLLAERVLLDIGKQLQGRPDEPGRAGPLEFSRSTSPGAAERPDWRTYPWLCRKVCEGVSPNNAL